MESSNNHNTWRQAARSPRRPSACGYGDRSGKLTLVVLVAIIGMAVLIGFVGNAGHVVTTKVNSQNAADAIAFSTAQWMARGMNAVTATNHLLGEVTGIVVVIEALGGPEADLELEDYPPQSRITDQANRQLAEMAYIQGNPAFGTKIAGPIDQKFLKAVILNLISKEEKDAKHKAFATIYDSKVVLKRAATKRLIAKFLANFLLYVPPPWGYLSALGAYAIHIGANIQLVEIGIEWVILHGLEKVVTSGVVRRLKVDVLEGKLIPALAAHGDFLAGNPSKAAKDRPKSEAGGVVNNAIRQTLDRLEGVYHVEAAIFPTATTYPLVATLRLPIEAEPRPSMKRTFRDERGVGDDDLVFEDPDDQLKKIEDEINDKKKKVRDRIAELQVSLAFLEGLDKKIDAIKKDIEDRKKESEELKKKDDITEQELATLNQEITALTQELADLEVEKGEVAQDIVDMKALIQKRVAELKELEAREKQMKDTIKQFQSAPPGSGNISMDRGHLALSVMNQKEERYTQWVRASFPYVDSFRAPILTLFQKYLKRSEAGKHYKKWTNRYTLVKAWKFRSGYRFYRAGNNKGEWREDPDTEPLRMYVMDGSFERNPRDMDVIRTGRSDRKGFELWTKDTTAGKNLAEDKFTVIAMTHTKIEPHFSPVIYPVASRNGITTFAQAIFYNSNKQEPVRFDTSQSAQAKLGWDTLNWDPNVTVLEWGEAANLAIDPKKDFWPWEVFDSNEELGKFARVKLNWQAKLMPVTKRRFQSALRAALPPSGNLEMFQNVTIAWPIVDSMVTH